MKVIRSLKYFNLLNNSALTIGNFDGVHLGHQALINNVAKTAKDKGLASVVVTFEPYPQEFFQKKNNSSFVKISSFQEKYQKLKSFGIDYLIILKFSENFAKVSACDFIKDVLVNKLKTKYIFIGDDFRFGNNRLGNYQLLKNQSNKYGYNVKKCNSVLVNNQDEPIRVSSTNIRKLLLNNNCKLAQKLLGRNFGLYGQSCKRPRTWS